MELKIGETFSSAVQAFKDYVGYGQPLPEEILRKTIFGVDTTLPKMAPLALSGHSTGSAFVVSDYTSLYRAFHDALLNSIGVCSGYYGWFKDFLTGGNVSFGYHAFGTATGLNAIIGAIQVIHALDQIRFSEAIGDTRATLMGKIDILKGVSLSGAGISFAVFRPLGMVEAIKHTSSLLGRVSLGFANAGTIFYALFFVFISAVFGIKLYEDSKFRHQLNKAENLAEAVEFIQKKANADPKKVYEKLVKKCGSEEAARKVFIEEAYASGKESLTLLMKEMGIAKPSDEKLKEIVYKLVESGCNGWTADRVKQQVEESLFLTGLQMRVGKIGLKREQKLERLFSPKAVEAVKALAAEKSLAGRVRLEDADAVSKAQKLIDVIKSASTRKIMVNTLVLAVCLLGIAAMIAAVVFTSGGALVFAAILMLVFSIGMFGVDGYFLLESYHDERPAQNDKKMLLFSSTIAILSFVSILALGLSGVMSMGTVPLIVAAVLLALWLGQNGLTWAVMNRNEKRHKLKHPTLEILLEAIQNQESEERIAQMIGNLPREVNEELKELGGDREESVLFLIHRVEKAKNEQLEKMREALVPLLIN